METPLLLRRSVILSAWSSFLQHASDASRDCKIKEGPVIIINSLSPEARRAVTPVQENSNTQLCVYVDAEDTV